MTSERGANAPESPGSGQDLATLGSRFVALVIDWVFALVLAYGLEWSLGWSVELMGVDQLPSIVFFVDYALLLAIGTQTAGMAAMKIACVSATTGGRIAPWQAVVRAFLLSLVIPALTTFFHPYNRGLHDLASGSVVLKAPADRDRSSGRLRG